MSYRDTRDAPHVLRTRDLTAAGWRHRDLRAAVAQGRLVRARRGVYLPTDTDADCLAAAELRGRLACVSELRRRGVFVLEPAARHFHVAPDAARLPASAAGDRVHRERLLRMPHPRSISVEVLDAVRQAVRCQPSRAAIATIDSALHLGVLPHHDLEELFESLPRRFRRLRRLLDSRSESGPETFLRLILRSIGCRVEIQVLIGDVGRVDFLVDGWLIIECDSEAHHSSWLEQKRDRRRDQRSATPPTARSRKTFCGMRIGYARPSPGFSPAARRGGVRPRAEPRPDRSSRVEPRDPCRKSRGNPTSRGRQVPL